MSRILIAGMMVAVLVGSAVPAEAVSSMQLPPGTYNFVQTGPTPIPNPDLGGQMSVGNDPSDPNNNYWTGNDGQSGPAGWSGPGGDYYTIPLESRLYVYEEEQPDGSKTRTWVRTDSQGNWTAWGTWS